MAVQFRYFRIGGVTLPESKRGRHIIAVRTELKSKTPISGTLDTLAAADLQIKPFQRV